MQAKVIIQAPRRTTDSYGQGHFGAPRGNHTHKGIDFAAWPGSVVVSPVKGQVTKLGYCYPDTQDYRYVEVTDGASARHRFFYTEPLIAYGAFVEEGTPLGAVQDLRLRYHSDLTHKEPITPHCHYEIILPNGEYQDPDEYWANA